MDTGDFEVIMIISDRKRFEAEDKGGAIYFVSKDNFSYIKDKSLGLYEWTSNKPAKPILQINFPSALKAMEQLGVKVYFK
jgi:hypothetical protein